MCLKIPIQAKSDAPVQRGGGGKRCVRGVCKVLSETVQIFLLRGLLKEPISTRLRSPNLPGKTAHDGCINRVLWSSAKLGWGEQSGFFYDDLVTLYSLGNLREFRLNRPYSGVYVDQS